MCDPNRSFRVPLYSCPSAVVQPADPGHSVPDTNEQLFGSAAKQPISAVPPMDGFIQSYSKFNQDKSGGGFIMECFDPSHVPVLSQLVDEFAIYNAWRACPRDRFGFV